MKRTILTGLCALALLFTTACSSDDSIQQATNESMQQFGQAGIANMHNDALFIAEAASANMLQVQLAELARDKAVSPEVKEMAQQVLQDHQAIAADLEQMTSKSRFVTPATLGAAHQEVYDEVSANSGLTFDIAYVKEEVNQHEALLERYEDMAEHGTSMEVKQFASKQLPVLRQHLQQAQALKDKIEDAA